MGWARFHQAAIVALAAVAVYGATLTSRPSWDSLRHGAQLAFDRPEGLASAHHPLGGLLAYAIYRGAGAAGYEPTPLTVLQLLSAACAALALAGIFSLVGRGAGSTALAAAVALGLGGSLAYWQAATDGEVYAVSAAALVAAWWALLASEGRAVGATIGAGAVGGVAVLSHQFHLALVLWAPFWLWRLRRSLAPAFAYLLGFVLAAGVGYVLAWVVSGYARTPYGFYAWFTHYARVGFHFPAARPDDVALGLMRSIVPLSASWPLRRLAMADLFALSALGGILVVALREGRRGHGAAGAGLAASSAVTALVLAAIWEPLSGKFWVPALVSGWLAIGLALVRLRGGIVLGIAATAAAIAALSATVVVRGAAMPNAYSGAVRRIGAVTGENDLILLPPDILSPAVAYYARRPHVTNVFAVFLRARYLRADPLAHLAEAVRRCRLRGGRIFVSSDALDVRADRYAMIAPLPPSLSALFPGQQLRGVAEYELDGRGRVLFEVRPPSAPRPAGSSGKRVRDAAAAAWKNSSSPQPSPHAVPEPRTVDCEPRRETDRAGSRHAPFPSAARGRTSRSSNGGRTGVRIGSSTVTESW